LSKNRSTLGRSREIAFSIGCPDAAVFLVQFPLRTGFEKALVNPSAARKFRLFQNITDAFEAGRQRLEIGRWPQILHAHQPRFQVHQVAPAGRHAGVNLVVLEAAVILEIEFHAVGEKVDERLVFFQEIEQRQLDPALHQNLHHALGGAPQRKGIARTGGDHAHPETAAQRVQLIGQRDDLAGAVARDAILHTLGLILVVDGLPYGFRLALRARI
jgi:hypothetical protein